MRRRHPILYQMLLCCWIGPGAEAFAQQSPASDEVKSDEPTATSTVQAPAVLIQEQKSRSSLSLSGRAIQAQLPGLNPLKAFHQLPGVTFQSADPWGNNEQNFSLFIHGFGAQQLGYTLDGVPLGDQQYGNYNGLSPQRAVISENVRNVVLNAGAGDLATASSSNLGGTLEFYSSDPSSRSAWTYAQSIGSYAASRSFVRYDSGEFDDQAFYLSASRLRARAWDFDATQGGEHLNAKWVKHKGATKVTAFYSYSDKTEPNEDGVLNGARERFVPYTRPFTYPDFAFALNYVNERGQPPLQDGANYRNYFGVAQRRDHLAYAKVEQELSEGAAWSQQIYAHADDGLGAVAGPIGVAGLPDLFKVYFPNADLKQSFGGSGYAVRTTEYQIRRFGLISQWQQKVDQHQWMASLWLEHNRSGADRRWYALEVSRPLTPYQTPRNPKITQYESEIDNKLVQFSLQDEWQIHPQLKLQAGWKSSLQFADGRFPVQPKLGAINGGSSALPEGSIVTKQWWLPQFGGLWQMNAEQQLYFNLQKNLRQFVTYGAVGLSPWSLNSQSAFELFKRTVKPETAKTFEAGWRMRSRLSEQSAAATGLEQVEAQVTTYFVEFNDRLLQISPSPVISSIVNGNPILTNVGAVRTQGVDLALNLNWKSGWTLTNNFSYNSSVYQDDYLNGTTPVATKDKQVPASPQWMNKTRVAFRHADWEWQVDSDYVGRRFTTFTNDLSVPRYHVFGMGVQYRLTTLMGTKSDHYLSLHVSNLTNQQGSSTLQVGAPSGSYVSFPIPPRQWFLSLRGSF